MLIRTRHAFSQIRNYFNYKSAFVILLLLCYIYFFSNLNDTATHWDATVLQLKHHSDIILNETGVYASKSPHPNDVNYASVNHPIHGGIQLGLKEQNVEEALLAIANETDSTAVDSGNSNSNPFKIDVSELNLPPVIQSYPETQSKFLIPFVTHFIGGGNQWMEYISAAVIARALNRTLCLTPFRFGPSIHGNFSSTASWGMEVQERYDISYLKRFVPVISDKRCFSNCNGSMDGFWKLNGNRSNSHPHWNPSSYEANLYLESHNRKWKSISEIYKVLGGKTEKCVGLGSIFPGLRWQGAYLSIQPFLKLSSRLTAASSFLSTSLGLPHRYLGVHWRFWEPTCKPEEYGLCFARCQNGAIQNQPHLVPNDSSWEAFVSKGGCPKDGKRYRFIGVKVKADNIVHAISQRLTYHNLSHLYLSSDAENRGYESCLLFDKVVGGLQDKGFHVLGMFKCLNFTWKSFPRPSELQIFSKIKVVPPEQVSSRVLSLIEQDILRNSEIFLGSGQSTWSLPVMDHRRTIRTVKLAIQNLDFSNMTNNFGDEVHNWPNVKIVNPHVDNMITNFLLSFTHTASQNCAYKRSSTDVKKERILDYMEAVASGKDGWLEYDACEHRMKMGDKCEIGVCWV